MKDSRKHKRNDMTLRVSYRDEAKSLSRVKVVRANISLGGVCMHLSEPIGIGKRLLFAISASFWGAPIKVRGVVVWQEFSELCHRYLVGVKFTDVPWTQLKALF